MAIGGAGAWLVVVLLFAERRSWGPAIASTGWGSELLVVAVVANVNGEVHARTLEVHARALDADLLQGDHEHADKLVAALQTQAFILPVGLVEKDDVESHREVFGDLAHFGEDVGLEFAFFAADKLQQALAQRVDLFERRPVFDYDGDGFGESARATLVQDEESIEITVGRLDDVALHLLELGIQEGDLLDKVVVTKASISGVTVDSDTVSHVEGVLDENEND